MPGQPTEIVGVIGVVIFMMMMLSSMLKEMFAPTTKVKKPMSTKDWDVVTMGVIEDRFIPEEFVEVKPEPAKKKVDNTLFNECVSALVNLGVKKAEAKRDAKQIFENNDITSVEQFIRIAFSK